MKMTSFELAKPLNHASIWIDHNTWSRPVWRLPCAAVSFC